MTPCGCWKRSAAHAGCPCRTSRTPRGGTAWTLTGRGESYPTKRPAVCIHGEHRTRPPDLRGRIGVTEPVQVTNNNSMYEAQISLHMRNYLTNRCRGDKIVTLDIR